MSKGSASALDAVLTGAALGELLGISSRRIRELRDDGAIPDNGAGQYVLRDAVRAYCAHIRPASGKAAAGGSETGTSLDTARTRLVNLQGDAREMLNAQLRGDAVLSEDLETVVGAIMSAVRSKLLALPATAAGQVVGLSDVVDIRETLGRLTHAILTELASTEIVDAVKDRARRRAGRSSDGDETDEDSGSPA